MQVSNRQFSRLLESVMMNGSANVIIGSLPKQSLLVLVTARKVAHKAHQFNFEAVFQRYKGYMFNLQKTNMAGGLVDLGRQTFLKLFVDLVRQGLLRSESDNQILSVNNKIALGFQTSDFDRMLRDVDLKLPDAIKSWV